MNESREIAIKLFASLLIIGGFLYFFASAPSDFPSNQVLTIPKGASLSSAAQYLKGQGVVRSATMLELLVRLARKQNSFLSGDYIFSGPQSAFQVAAKLEAGERGFSLIHVTIPEGSTVAAIGQLLGTGFYRITPDGFVALARRQEGYLFPDTYFLQANVTPANVIDRMRATFDQKILPLQADIQKSGHLQSDVIIMASILEAEARTTETRQIVAGILWKRIKLGMPLQVDSTLRYVTGRDSSQLTSDDLDSSSPYNTYRHKGLPPGPIDNPGLEAITDALHPKATPYLYFLSDANGVMHYAATFEQHVANKQKYLK